MRKPVVSDRTPKLSINLALACESSPVVTRMIVQVQWSMKVFRKIASENISVCWVQVLAWFRYVEKWNVILGSDGEKLFERGCIVEAGTKLSFGQV